MLSPSLLSCPKEKIPMVLEELKNAKVEYLHVDVMDGKFVPATSFPMEEVSALRKLTPLPMDVHLMVMHPENYYETLKKIGCKIVTLHVEIHQNIACHLAKIHELGLLAGVAINPETNLAEMYPYLKYADLILVMSVHPGKGGQTFISSSLDKIKELDNQRKKYHYSYLIEVDGGINPTNIRNCKMAGCDIFVSGSSIVCSNNISDVIQKLREEIKLGSHDETK
jgi:ribulose-phosphate 3-epimerase